MSSATETGSSKKRVKLNKKTGGLRRLPVVKPHKEIIATARRQAYQESDPDKKIKNAKLRARKQATVKLDSLTKVGTLSIDQHSIVVFLNDLYEYA